MIFRAGDLREIECSSFHHGYDMTANQCVPVQCVYTFCSYLLLAVVAFQFIVRFLRLNYVRMHECMLVFYFGWRKTMSNRSPLFFYRTFSVFIAAHFFLLHVIFLSTHFYWSFINYTGERALLGVFFSFFFIFVLFLFICVCVCISFAGLQKKIQPIFIIISVRMASLEFWFLMQKTSFFCSSVEKWRYDARCPCYSVFRNWMQKKGSGTMNQTRDEKMLSVCVCVCLSRVCKICTSVWVTQRDHEKIEIVGTACMQNRRIDRQRWVDFCFSFSSFSPRCFSSCLRILGVCVCEYLEFASFPRNLILSVDVGERGHT